jgi:hypothetical protein
MAGRIYVKSNDPIRRARCFSPLHRDRAEISSLTISQSIFSDFRRGREAMASISDHFKHEPSPELSRKNISSILRQHSTNFRRVVEES